MNIIYYVNSRWFFWNRLSLSLSVLPLSRLCASHTLASRSHLISSCVCSLFCRIRFVRCCSVCKCLCIVVTFSQFPSASAVAVDDSTRFFSQSTAIGCLLFTTAYLMISLRLFFALSLSLPQFVDYRCSIEASKKTDATKFKFEEKKT